MWLRKAKFLNLQTLQIFNFWVGQMTRPKVVGNATYWPRYDWANRSIRSDCFTSSEKEIFAGCDQNIRNCTFEHSLKIT